MPFWPQVGRGKRILAKWGKRPCHRQWEKAREKSPVIRSLAKKGPIPCIWLSLGTAKEAWGASNVWF